jgi:dUTP pyrophosphatase
MKVNAKFLTKSARTNGLPAYESAGAAGLDLKADLPDGPALLEAGKRLLIKTGMAIELPLGFEAQVRSRSGLAIKSGVIVLNAPGTVDADYRGDVGVILYNTSDESYQINHGDRIAQLVVAPITLAELVEVEELASTDRGAGGFGSTGVKS